MRLPYKRRDALLQGLREFVGRLKASTWVLFECPPHDRPQTSRQVLTLGALSERNGFVEDVTPYELHGAGSVVGEFRGQNLIEHHTQGVQVGPVLKLTLLGQLELN